jgi:hypothetical protein
MTTHSPTIHNMVPITVVMPHLGPEGGEKRMVSVEEDLEFHALSAIPYITAGKVTAVTYVSHGRDVAESDEFVA